MSAKRRIGLYGGTFDPVHLGHLEVARGVCRLFDIEQVLFVPAQRAPHKTGSPVTAPIYRYAMLALATQYDHRFVVSTFELNGPGRRYTVDSVTHFQSVFSDDAALFFIMGADSWSEITTWREWERLLGMVNHVVVTRPGYELLETHVGNELRQRVIDLRGAEKSPSIEQGQPRIFLTDVAMRDVSATDIRRAARQGQYELLTDFVTPSVADYIRKYEVYREVHEA
ncbi:MAG: nicotinate-nucleotide adenylyltransferase [Pyrinomonadaceae bacterium]